jgi:hypothetical protein
MAVVFRNFGNILALIAVMASAINAQCALTCSLQALSSVAPTEAQMVQPNLAGHACCPRSKQTEPTKEKSPKPCSDPLVVIGGVNFADTNAAAVSQHFDPALDQQLAKILLLRSSGQRFVTIDRRNTFSPPVLAALRI